MKKGVSFKMFFCLSGFYIKHNLVILAICLFLGFITGCGGGDPLIYKLPQKTLYHEEHETIIIDVSTLDPFISESHRICIYEAVTGSSSGTLKCHLSKKNIKTPVVNLQFCRREGEDTASSYDDYKRNNCQRTNQGEYIYESNIYQVFYDANGYSGVDIDKDNGIVTINRHLIHRVDTYGGTELYDVNFFDDLGQPFPSEGDKIIISYLYK